MPYRYYAVAVGREVGLFDSWALCQASVSGYPRAKFKGFNNLEQAEQYLEQWFDSGDQSWNNSSQQIYQNQNNNNNHQTNNHQTNNYQKNNTQNNNQYSDNDDSDDNDFYNDDQYENNAHELQLPYVSELQLDHFIIKSDQAIPHVIYYACQQQDIIMYVDGSAKPNPGPTGSGICLQWPTISHPHQQRHYKLTSISYAFDPHVGTNNWGELFGILRGFQTIEEMHHQNASGVSVLGKTLHIISDSEWAANVLTHHNTLRDDRYGRNPAATQNFFRRWLFKHGQSMGLTSIQFHWCKAHHGLMGNNIVDHLAHQGRVFSSNFLTGRHFDCNLFCVEVDRHDIHTPLSLEEYGPEEFYEYASYIQPRQPSAMTLSPIIGTYISTLSRIMDGGQ